MKALFCVLLLATACLAAEKNQRLDEIKQIPKNLRQMNFDYEGTIKTKNNEYPVTGNYKSFVKGNIIYMLDKANLDMNGKKIKLTNLAKRDLGMGKEDAYSLYDDSCLVQHYSEEEQTLPHASKWKEIGNNKFEMTLSNRFAVKKVLAKEFGQKLGAWANEEHDVKMRLQFTLKNNKIHSGKIVLIVDGNELATKDFRVVKHLTALPKETDFQVPSKCSQVSDAAKRKVIDLFEVLLGFKEEGALMKNQRQEMKEGGQEQQTAGKLEKTKKDEKYEDEENEESDENQKEENEETEEEEIPEDEESNEEEGQTEERENLREREDRL